MSQPHWSYRWTTRDLTFSITRGDTPGLFHAKCQQVPVYGEGRTPGLARKALFEGLRNLYGMLLSSRDLSPDLSKQLDMLKYYYKV